MLADAEGFSFLAGLRSLVTVAQEGQRTPQESQGTKCYICSCLEIQLYASKFESTHQRL